MLYIASDHGGFQLKKYLTRYLTNQLKREFKDLGPYEYMEADDYPDFGFDLAKKVASHKGAQGILICGSGQGMCIAANKVKGARAMLGYSIESAEKGRSDDDANIVCLAGRVVSDEHAAAIVKKFLETEFSNAERHVRRIKKIDQMEKRILHH